ncbi:MAG TPA: hypothetical protein VHO03_08005 [Ignavibacteriales bacterium]|nr:hypothetical protein [Ignavibacteriales bacterium]
MKPILFSGKMRLLCTSLLLFLIFHTNLFSQEVDCGIQTLDYSLAEATKYGDGNATRLHKALSSSYNIKVAVHIVGFANGTGGLSSNDAVASVGQVTSNFNRTFSSEGVQFNFQVISTDYLYDDNFMSETVNFSV